MREHGWATYWVGKNHNVPVDEFDMGSSKRNWPLARGFDRFYGFIGGETNQWYPEPRRGQPLHRPAVPARGGLPPVEGPRRQGARDDPQRQGEPAGQAVVHVLLPGREPRPAPRAAGVDRQVQGRVRRRLRGVPRVGAAADDRARHPAGGHRAHRDEPDVCRRPRTRTTPCGRGIRSPPTRSGCSPGWPRSTPGSQRVHRPPGRADRRLPRGDRAARQHADLLRAPTTARPARAARTAWSTRTVFNAWPSVDRGEPRADRQARDARHLQPLPDRLGDGLLHAVPDVQALHATRAACCDPLVVHWPKGIAGTRRGARPVPPRHRHRADDLRVLRDRRRPPRCSATSRPSCPASRCATASTTATRPRPRRRSTTRCSAPAASGTRAGRR